MTYYSLYYVLVNPTDYFTGNYMTRNEIRRAPLVPFNTINCCLSRLNQPIKQLSQQQSYKMINSKIKSANPTYLSSVENIFDTSVQYIIPICVCVCVFCFKGIFNMCVKLQTLIYY